MRALRTMLLLVAAGTAAMSTIAHAETLKRHTAKKVDVALMSSMTVAPKASVTKARICHNVCPITGNCLD